MVGSCHTPHTRAHAEPNRVGPGSSSSGVRSRPADTNAVRFRKIWTWKFLFWFYPFYLKFGFEIFRDFLFNLAQCSGSTHVYRKPHESVQIWSRGCCDPWTPRGYKNCFSQFILLHAKAATIILSSLCLLPLHFSTAKILFKFFFCFTGNKSPSEQRLSSSSWADIGELPGEFLPLGKEVASRSGRGTVFLLW